MTMREREKTDRPHCHIARSACISRRMDVKVTICNSVLRSVLGCGRVQMKNIPCATTSGFESIGGKYLMTIASHHYGSPLPRCL